MYFTCLVNCSCTLQEEFPCEIRALKDRTPLDDQVEQDMYSAATLRLAQQLKVQSMSSCNRLLNHTVRHYGRHPITVSGFGFGSYPAMSMMMCTPQYFHFCVIHLVGD